MKATLEKLEGNTVRVHIKVESAEVDEALQRAYRKVVKEVRIPGFRKGKAPRPILERYVGAEMLHQEAIEDLVPRVYADAVDELGIEPVDHPHFDIDSFEEGEDFEFHADVEVMPEVTLGDYKEVSLDYDEPSVAEEAVEEELENLRRSASQLVAVEDDEAELGEDQYAVINFKGYVDDELIEGGSAEEYVLEIGSGSFIEGFEEQLVGMTPGEERQITVTFPDDYGAEELAGKEAKFDVELLEIKQRQFPELDEDFLAEIGDYEDLEALKDDIRGRMATDATQEAERKYRNDIVTQVVDQAEVTIPDALVERRIDELIQELRDQFRQQNYSLDEYFEQTGQTMDELRTEFRERAQRDVKADLVLDAVAEAEGIEATDEDLDAELEAMGRMYGQPVDAFRSIMLSGENGGQLRHNIRVQKTIGYLEQIAGGTDASEALEAATRKYHERLEQIQGQMPAQPQEPVPGGLKFSESDEADAGDTVKEEIGDEQQN